MDRKGWDMAELSRRSGINYDSINKYQRGEVDNPRGNTLSVLAKTLGVEEIWLRDGISVASENTSHFRRNAKKVALENSGEARILEVDLRAGSGGGGMDSLNLNKTIDGGIIVSDDAISAEWGIPSAFLRGQLRVNPDKAWIVEIYGDSMYDPNNPGAPGSLFPGDRVIVDASDIRPSPPGAFAVWDGIGLVVKLVEVVARSEPPALRLSSRNPSYRPYEVTDEEARVIGRVRGRISAM